MHKKHKCNRRIAHICGYFDDILGQFADELKLFNGKINHQTLTILLLKMHFF